ncbi:hypothetical protein [Actinoallomurus sp. CA-150999]|uniref:hypothetical protein n=1 Tax=Actinoallomurus sp. CA-150999 TaxID=3239887 RepID=UPI003D8F0AD0
MGGNVLAPGRSPSLPSPVGQAIGLAKKILPITGAIIEETIYDIWGDPSALRGAATSGWGDLLKAADGSAKNINNIATTISSDGAWEGMAKQACSRWVGELNSETIAPIKEAFGAVRDALNGIADTIGDMHNVIIRQCIAFVGEVAAFYFGDGKAKIAAVVAFATSLWDLKANYVNALNKHVSTLQNIMDKPVGVNIPRPIDPLLPDLQIPTHVDARPMRWDILGDWDNWEHTKPKISDKQFDPTLPPNQDHKTPEIFKPFTQ